MDGRDRVGQLRPAGVSLYDSTFSRTVWRLDGGAKGLVVRYYRPAVAAAKPEPSAHHTPAHPRAYRTVAAAPTCKEAGFTLYVVTIIEIYSVKPPAARRRGAGRAAARGGRRRWPSAAGSLRHRLLYDAFGLIWFRTIYLELKSLMIQLCGTR